MTIVWIFACIASLGAGLLIAYADSARAIRQARAPNWNPRYRAEPLPGQGILADLERAA